MLNSNLTSLSVSSGHLRPEDRLIFMHIPKTGGTTLVKHLSSLFDPLEFCPERLDLIAMWPAAQLEKYRFFAAHAALRDFQFIPQPVKIITFLRNPIERCISLYRYWRSYRDEFIEARKLSELRLTKGFKIEFLYSPANFNQAGFLWNQYARYLVLDEYRAPSGRLWRDEEEILEHAQENLSKLNFVGIAEAFELSLDMMCRDLDIPNTYDGIKMNRTNLNHKKHEDVFKEVEEIPITNETIEIIQNANAIDMKIYEYALKKIHKGSLSARNIFCYSTAEVKLDMRKNNSEVWIQSRFYGFILHGPYMQLLPGRYTVEFAVRYCHDVIDGEDIGYVDVISAQGKSLHGRKNLPSGKKLSALAIIIEFSLTEIAGDLEFRVLSQQYARFEVCTKVLLRSL